MTELIASSAFGYGLIALLVAADGVFPVFPGETALIGGALLAADGELALAGVVLAGVAGGFAGDNCSYLLGAKLGRRAAPRVFRSERSRGRLEWARRQLRERGSVIILSARFIPVGRTATTFSAGMLGMSWRRFAPIDLVAVIAWSAYATTAGYLGGGALGLEGPVVLLGAIMIATALGLAAELARRLHAARARAAPAASDPADQPHPRHP